MANPRIMSYPPRKGTQGYFKMSEGVQAVNEIITSLFHTPPGTLPYNKRVGFNAYVLIFEDQGSPRVDLIPRALAAAVAEVLPAVRIARVTPAIQDAKIDFEVVWTSGEMTGTVNASIPRISEV